MDSSKKILIIDKAIDRKKRISALKQAGYAVFPALKLQEARSRCRSGAYDLVVVNAGDELQPSLEFCDDLTERSPSQPVLLLVPANSQLPERKFALADDLEQLVSKASTQLEGLSPDHTADSRTETVRATA